MRRPNRARTIVASLSLFGTVAVAGPACHVDDRNEPASSHPLTDTFDEIYNRAVWAADANGKGTSGSGSTRESTVEYRRFLEEFIKAKGITSVVDAGCGDWGFSQAIDWGGVDYLGLDISEVAIATARVHATEKIRFRVADITEPMPPADLLLVKDVLQHLPNRLIEKFIENNLRPDRYKWAILTNDRWPIPGRVGRPNNRDISPGQYRGIDLSASPFNVAGLRDAMRFKTEPAKIVQVWRGGAR